MSVKLGRNDPCWCGSGKKYKACHAAFDDKLARLAQEGHVVPTHDLIKTPDQIAGIKESAKINVAVLDYIEKNIHAGMNTAEIDKIVYDMTTSMGGIPAPLNYEGYPYSVCTSVNESYCPLPISNTIPSYPSGTWFPLVIVICGFRYNNNADENTSSA